MKIRIVAIGKCKGEWVSAATERFTKLLSRDCQLEIIETPEIKKSPDGSIETLINREGQRLLKKVRGDYVYCLDQHGDKLSSEQFAKAISKNQTSGKNSLDFVIGGAFGLSQEVQSKADRIFSLSDMTFSHQIARVVLLEQLFRAFSILKGSPYHK
ncbi:MAG: 23S rRNA (pseudouridine(1915)-N(3))-methyltransferase RlmH [candidate division Zixibacteria bacterium]|nr:23S rRNA (pseudouridine(1915)-N(3))-methyltransferase RlmH [candidate division Zixibacteria bacterium]